MYKTLFSAKFAKTLDFLIQVPVVNKSNNELPTHATPDSAGVDLRAHLTESLVLKPMQRMLIPTGLHMELPENHEGQIRPRSGLAYKHGISIVNAPGTIDADYRGELKVLLINLGQEEFAINNGDRIAQLVISKYEKVVFETKEKLSQTQRGSGGYGHTGK